jgi:hypothetical protein
MKMKRTGVCALMTAFLLAAALLVTTCMDPINVFEGSSNDTSPGTGRGLLQINLGGTGARTILPVVGSGLNILSYRITIEGRNSTSNPDLGGGANYMEDWTTSSSPIELLDGEYTVTIDAFTGAGYTNRVATGFDSLVEMTAAGGTATITLQLVNQSGSGSFEWNFTGIDAGYTNVNGTVVFTRVGGGTPITQINFGTGNWTGTEASVGYGVYDAVFTISADDHQSLIFTDIVHIYDNLRTVWTESTPFSLIPNEYLVTYNANGGFESLPSTVYTETDDITFNTTIGIGNIPSEPVRSGFTFNSWWSRQGLTLGEVAGHQWNFDVHRVIGPMQLWARWDEVASLTINFTDFSLSNPLTASGVASVNLFEIQNGAGSINRTVTITANFVSGSNFEWSFNNQSLAAFATNEVLTLDFATIYANSGGAHDDIQGLLSRPNTHIITVTADDGSSTWSARIDINTLDYDPNP